MENSENLPEKANVWDETINDFVSAMAVTRPDLVDVLTAGAISAYARFPDESFGWSANGVMSMPMKLAAIGAHLSLGLQPGLGHLFFLGNSIYISAQAARTKANADPLWIIVEEKYLPHSNEEREMFGLSEGDMSCKYRAQVKIGNNDLVWLEGDGIIDLDEIRRNKVWAGTKKNIAMNLKTRAERDFLKRHYPLSGVVIADKFDIDILDANFTDNDSPSKDRTTMKEAIAKEGKISEAGQIGDLALDLTEAVKDATIRGVDPRTIKEALGMELREFLNHPPSAIQEAVEVISGLKPGEAVPASDSETVVEGKVSNTAKKAYSILKEVLDDKHTPEESLEILAELAVANLKEGDEFHIAEGLKQLKVTGDMTKLKSLLLDRM